MQTFVKPGELISFKSTGECAGTLQAGANVRLTLPNIFGDGSITQVQSGAKNTDLELGPFGVTSRSFLDLLMEHLSCTVDRMKMI